MPHLPPAVRVAAQVLWVDHVTAEVVAAMREAGVRPLLLKGPSTATWLYGDGPPRPYGDTDLLVAPASYRRAGDVLRELGFRHLEHALSRDVQEWVRGPETSDADLRAAFLDLHRSLINVRAPADTVWEVLSAATDTLRVGGVDVEVLCVPARALHVALHAAQHGVLDFARPLEDLARALRLADEHIWREAAELARRIDALPAFAAGLRLDVHGARVAERLRLPAELPAGVALRSGVQHPVAIALEGLASERSLSARARLLGRALVPSRLYMRHWSARYMTRWPAALREGRIGLWLAYLWRPIWKIGQLPRATIAWRRARRG
jgi:hypothetical protein